MHYTPLQSGSSFSHILGVFPCLFISFQLLFPLQNLFLDTPGDEKNAYRRRWDSPFYGIDVPDDECERDCLREIETAFRTYLPANEVAAVIIEPMQGDIGMLPAHHIFMRKLSSLCRENGILFIAEEVQLAFWRTGKCFSIEHYLEDDAYPDGIIMGKSVGGGLVLGAFMARESIIRSLESPAHIFTLAGNHLSCAAGLASLRYMQGNEYQ